MVLSVYRKTQTFPDAEKFGLVSQMRRAAVSVAANLIEGFNRETDADKRHFYVISRGSLEELRYYFELSKDLGLIADNGTDDGTAEEVSKMLNALIKTMQIPK